MAVAAPAGPPVGFKCATVEPFTRELLKLWAFVPGPGLVHEAARSRRRPGARMASLSADDGSSGAVVTLTLTRVAVARLLVAVAPLLVAVPPLLADRGVHDVVAPSNRLGMTAIRVGSATSAATTATVRGFTGAILRYGAE